MKRFVVAGVLSVAVLLLCLIGKLAYDVHKLTAYRSYVERHYAPQISLIERSCTDSPERELSEADILKEQKTVEVIEKSLSSTGVFCASWSYDGHHGLASLKPMKTGFTSYCIGILGSHSEDGHHSLYYGKTFDHRGVLVYEGRVPSGGKRHYQIVLVFADIKDAVNNQSP